MALAQVVAGARIVTSDANQYYNILKGVTGSGETVTLIYNAAGSLIFQPSSDPAADTQVLQVKNNAGTVQSALTYDGNVILKTYAAIGTPPATAGVLRIPNDQYIQARNAANTDNLQMMKIDSSNVLIVGNSGGNPVSYQGTSTHTFGGIVITPATATASAGLRVPHGTAPTSPVNGDMWTTTSGLFVRINGSTVGPLS
jgi:hypothetical protein